MNIETPPSPQAVSRRRLLAATAAAVGFGAVAPARAQAAWRPSGPVKLIVTFPPGGATDILTRMIAPGLAEYLRQTVVVENRPGATGSIGSGHVYAAPPDGTTLLIGAPDALSIFPKLSKTTYDPNKFVPLAPLGSTSFILLARPGLPATNLQELIALARKQRLTIANAGTGGSGHLVSIAFCQAAGIPEARVKLETPQSAEANLAGEDPAARRVAATPDATYTTARAMYPTLSFDRQSFDPAMLESMVLRAAGGLVALTAEAIDPVSAGGKVLLLDRNGRLLRAFAVGSGPERVAFTPNFGRIFSAAEARQMQFGGRIVF